MTEGKSVLPRGLLWLLVCDI